MKHNFVLLVFSIIFTWSSIAFGKDVNRVKIHSEEAVINYKNGTEIYSGNVVINSGPFHIEADEVTEYKEGSKTIRVVALGKPAEFTQAPLIEGGLSNGYAEEIDYLVLEGKIKLKNYEIRNAIGNTQSGENATYIFQK